MSYVEEAKKAFFDERWNDGIVFDLYGLTAEERARVQGAGK